MLRAIAFGVLIAGFTFAAGGPAAACQRINSAAQTGDRGLCSMSCVAIKQSDMLPFA